MAYRASTIFLNIGVEHSEGVGIIYKFYSSIL